MTKKESHKDQIFRYYQFLETTLRFLKNMIEQDKKFETAAFDFNTWTDAEQPLFRKKRFQETTDDVAIFSKETLAFAKKINSPNNPDSCVKMYAITEEEKERVLKILRKNKETRLGVNMKKPKKQKTKPN